MTPTFISTAAPGRRTLITASIVGAALVLAAIAACANASRSVVEIPAFLPICATTTGLTQLITAYLLLAQARVTRDAAPAILAFAFLFGALAAAAQLLVFPGVFSPAGLLGAGPQSATWLWAASHVGLSALLCCYVAIDRMPRMRRVLTARLAFWGSLGVAVLVAAALAAVTLGHDRLPVIVWRGITAASLPRGSARQSSRSIWRRWRPS
jgi:hypothetical protein